MRSDRAPLWLRILAGGGLLFLHLPILLIFVYAFSTEKRSYQWPPPGLTLQWFGAAWNRPDIWAAMGLSLRVAAVSTALALILARFAPLPSPSRGSSDARLSACWSPCPSRCPASSPAFRCARPSR